MIGTYRREVRHSKMEDKAAREVLAVLEAEIQNEAANNH
jgi:hypothetical protein